MPKRAERLKPADFSPVFREALDALPDGQRELVLSGVGDSTSRPKRKRPAAAKLNRAFVSACCRQAGLPAPEYEWRGHPTRLYRYDIAWPKYKVALEADGGIYGAHGRKGAHGSISGILHDIEKSNESQIAGILILRVPFNRITERATLDLVERALRRRGWKPRWTP